MASGRPFSKVSDEELLRAAAVATNMRQLLLTLGIAAYGGNYESVRRRLARYGALPECLRPRRQRHPRTFLLRATDVELAQAAAQSATKADVLRQLGLSPEPGMYRELNRRLAAAGVDIAHLKGRSWSRGLKTGPRRPLDDVLTAESSIGTHILRLRLLDEGVFPHQCACCERSEWQGRPIPLELDHIDGDRSNNRIENLRLLCPNCHAQTVTYRGRNVGRPFEASPLPEPLVARWSASERLTRILQSA